MALNFLTDFLSLTAGDFSFLSSTEVGGFAVAIRSSSFFCSCERSFHLPHVTRIACKRRHCATAGHERNAPGPKFAFAHLKRCLCLRANPAAVVSPEHRHSHFRFARRSFAHMDVSRRSHGDCDAGAAVHVRACAGFTSPGWVLSERTFWRSLK